MAVQVELWKQGIVNALFRKNVFLKFGTDVTSEVLGGAVVHISQSGGPAGAQRNRTVIPATVISRADTDVTYALDNFTSDPLRVTKMEQADINYQKMQSMIDETGAFMFQLAGDAVLEYWCRNVPNNANFRLATTGAAKAVAGLTGTRKKTTAADLRTLQTMMDVQEIPDEDRYLIITPDMHQDLLEDADIKNVFAFTNVDFSTGNLPMYAGFKIMKRSRVHRVTADGATSRLPDSGVATLGTDNFCGVAFHKSCVEYALGERNLIYTPNLAASYGDEMSMFIRVGGRARRGDNKGVLLLTQGV
jgi:hypothetical protein